MFKKIMIYCIVILLLIPLFADAQGYNDNPPYYDLSHNSKTFGHKKYFRLYLPAGYKTSGKRYPVIYFFHGWGGRHFKDENAKLEYEKLKTLVDKYQVLLVMWDGNIDEKEPRPYNIGNHEDVKFDVQMKDYFPELTGYIDSAYRTFIDRNHRAIIGFSMGGIMSLYLAGKYPDKVCAAVSLAGSPEFFIGYPGNHTWYPLRYTFANLKGVNTRMHNGNTDILYYLNKEVYKGALWEGLAPEYWEFDGGHMVDKPGETIAFEKAMTFITNTFKNPSLAPQIWSHYDLYPDFNVWDYQVKSDKKKPGFLFLKNVGKKGFGLYSYQWLPDGPALPGVNVTVTTAPVYVPGKMYQVKSFINATGQIKSREIKSDTGGRLTIEMTAAGCETSISEKSDAPEFVYLDYKTGKNYRFLHMGNNRLIIRLFNRGGERLLPGTMYVSIATSDSTVAIKKNVLQARVKPGQRIITLPPLLVECFKRPPLHGEPSEIKFRVQVNTTGNDDDFVVPVFFDAALFKNVRIDDGIIIKDSSWGTGNGDGIIQAGERVLLYEGSHRLRLYTEDPWVKKDDAQLVSEMIPAIWADGFTWNSIVHIDPACPDGHHIEFLAFYETKTYNPIERKKNWGRVKITVYNKGN